MERGQASGDSVESPPGDESYPDAINSPGLHRKWIECWLSSFLYLALIVAYRGRWIGGLIGGVRMYK